MTKLILEDLDSGSGFKFDSADLHFFIPQLAAGVLKALETMPHVDGYNYPKHGLGGILNRHVSWAPNGYVGALVSHVQLLYDVVEINTKRESTQPGVILPLGESVLIAKALAEFQGYCDALRSTYKEGDFSLRKFVDCSQSGRWDDLNVRLLYHHSDDTNLIYGRDVLSRFQSNVPYYGGCLAAVIDDGKSLRFVEPTKVYSPQQTAVSRITDTKLDRLGQEYGTFTHLPHILVGRKKIEGNLGKFQDSLDVYVNGLNSGQLQNLRETLPQPPFEILERVKYTKPE